MTYVIVYTCAVTNSHTETSVFWSVAGRAVYGFEVPHEAALFIELPETNVAFERLDIANTMNRRQVPGQIAFIHKLPAANLALVPGDMVLWLLSGRWMRSVVVSADFWLVAERHVADLTLDSGRPCLYNTAETNISYTGH